MTEPPSDASVSPESMSYEQLVGNLEQLTQRMADGAIGIEEAVELYERAGRLEELARARLERVQRRIENLAEEGDGRTGPAPAESPEPGGP
ncbi:MAG: exodeoxyribonuclease VII small subunit [Actinomycetota bacterium]|nr:exodeoxyribonuclease VII small subunit [Actinomycetota bacterium]